MTNAIILAMMSNTLARGIYFASIAHIGMKNALIRYAIWALLHGFVLSGFIL